MGSIFLIVSILIAVLTPAIPAEAEAPRARIVILATEAGRNVFQEANQNYDAGAELWTSLAATLGMTSRVVDEPELLKALADADLLIVHSSEAMSDLTFESILGFSKGGGSVLLTGMPGLMDQKGNKREKSLAELLVNLGTPILLASEKTDDILALMIRRGTPLGWFATPGFRMELDRTRRIWTGTAGLQDGHYVGWTLRALFGEPRSIESSTGLILREDLGARSMWLGTTPDSFYIWDEQKVERDTILTTALLWLAHKPLVVKARWPRGIPAAAVVTADVEDKFENGEPTALVLHREGVPGSFFLLGKLVPDNPQVAYALARNGEVGSHSMLHEAFKGRTEESQVAEIRESMKVIQAAGVPVLRGFRPPMEEYDENTIKAVADAGMDYIFGNLDYQCSWPIRRKVGDRILYQFARIVDDDFNIAEQRHGITPTEYKRLFIQEAYRVINVGGIYPLAFHTNYLATEDNLVVLESVIRWLKTQDLWITTFADIVDWIRGWDDVELQAESGPNSLSLTVRNNHSTSIRDLVLIYLPPREDLKPRFMEPQDDLTLVQDPDYGYRIQLNLEPGEVRRLMIH